TTQNRAVAKTIKIKENKHVSTRTFIVSWSNAMLETDCKSFRKFFSSSLSSSCNVFSRARALSSSSWRRSNVRTATTQSARRALACQSCFATVRNKKSRSIHEWAASTTAESDDHMHID